MPTPITIYSVSRTVADGDGGQLLEIQGDFIGEFSKEYQIHIGPNGNYTDPACYSGKPGNPQILYPLNDSKLRGYTPPMLAGGPYSIYVRRVDMVRDIVLPSAIIVLPPMHYSGVFSLRSIFPIYYFMGPRNLENVERIP